MKRVILELVDIFDNNKVYFTEVPEIFKKHYIKKYKKQGYSVTDWDEIFAKVEETEQWEEILDKHIPFI